MYIILLLLLFTACTPRQQVMDYALSGDATPFAADSLKMEILSINGVEMVVMYPDSNVMSIRYDRFRTHHKCLEELMTAAGYEYKIMNKRSAEEK